MVAETPSSLNGVNVDQLCGYRERDQGQPGPGQVPVPGGHGVGSTADLGSGTAFDALQVATMVGLSGRVVGVDMTPAMIEKARANAKLLGLGNVEFREGYLEALPIADGNVDVVLSNGVVNLCPDKARVLAEAFRVLKPGGRMQISDIVVARVVPEDAKADIALWTG